MISRNHPDDVIISNLAVLEPGMHCYEEIARPTSAMNRHRRRHLRFHGHDEGHFDQVDNEIFDSDSEIDEYSSSDSSIGDENNATWNITNARTVRFKVMKDEEKLSSKKEKGDKSDVADDSGNDSFDKVDVSKSDCNPGGSSTGRWSL